MLDAVEQTKFLLEESQLRGAGTTSGRTCRARRSRCCTPAPASRSARTTSRRSSRWSSSSRRSARSRRSRSRTRCSTSTASGADAALPRAPAREQAIGTRSRIFYKYEGVSPPGSHKPNTAVAQAYYNKQEGGRALATETGAGQWGSALAFACKLLGLECKVYMVRISYDQKPFRRSLIQAWGARSCRARPRRRRAGGRSSSEHPDSPGSLGIAISEAVEDAAGREDTAYSLGSVLNHVLLHQTVIGQEALAQMELAGAFPDVVVGCVGGGSNFAGLAFPFLREKIAGREIDVLACEPAACPTLTRGVFAYDFGDTSKLTPLVADAHARPRLRPRADPRRRAALPRRRAADLAARAGRARPRGGVPAERRLRVGGPLRRHRGDPPGARGGARDPRRARGGAAADEAARSGRSSSTSRATATSTWPRTTTTSPASSRTSRSTRTRSSARCARSRASPRRLDP